MAEITPLQRKTELCDTSEVENEKKLLKEIWFKVHGITFFKLEPNFNQVELTVNFYKLIILQGVRILMLRNTLSLLEMKT